MLELESPMWPALVLAFQVARIGFFVLGIASALGFVLFGARRWVRLLVVAFLIDGFVYHLLVAGPAAAFSIVARALLVAGALSYFATLSIRYPLRIRLDPANNESWPSHAAESIARWTRELASLEFEGSADVSYVWRAFGSARLTRQLLFAHPVTPCWAILAAAARPKVLGRILASRLSDGRWLLTFDRLNDFDMVRDPAVVVERVAASTSMAEMLDRHTRRIAALGVAAVPVADALEEQRRYRDGVADRLVASRQFSVKGEWIRPTMVSALWMVGRMYAAWLR